MKKVTALILGLFLASFSVNAANDASATIILNNDRSYIFVEGGVEFSVYTDGQFDFVYVGNGSTTNLSINTPGVNVSFNSGYNYDAYVQYDDYGAVIQVEDVPIYYDEFGRIIQAGSVEIRYNNRRIVRVGGQRIFYNSFGYFDYCTGFISPWYTTYVYRPWHVFYIRPFYTNCIVWDFPYRRWYSPVRYTYAYHRNFYHRGYRYYRNARRGTFYRPGSRIHYRDGRTARNRNFNPNRRNTAVSRAYSGKRSEFVGRDRNNSVNRGTSRGIAGRDDNATLNRNNVSRRDNNSVRNGSNRGTANRSNSVSRDVRRDKSVSSSSSNGTVTRGRPNNSIKKSTRPTSVNRGRPAGTRDKAIARNSPPKRNNSVSRSNKSSRSKGSVSKQRSSNRSRSTAPRRGRGL